MHSRLTTRAWAVSLCLSGAIVVFCAGFVTGEATLARELNRSAPIAVVDSTARHDSIVLAKHARRARYYCAEADSLTAMRPADDVGAWWAREACNASRRYLADVAAGIETPE